MSFNQIVGARLYEARQAAGWSQEEFGRRLEPVLGTRWSKSLVSSAESSRLGEGRQRAFSIDELMAFAQIFRKPIAWFLLPDTEDPARVGAPGAAEASVLAPDEAAWLVALTMANPEVRNRVEELVSRSPKGVPERLAEALPLEAFNVDRVVREELVSWIRSMARQWLGDVGRWPSALRGLADVLDEKVVELEETMEAGPAAWIEQYEQYQRKQEVPSETEEEDEK